MITVKFENKTLKVKDCTSMIDSGIGLMFHSLNKIDGALIFGNRIWMPFIKKPLQLVFIDEKKKVTSVQRAVPLKAHPKTWKIYYDRSARYCLELIKPLKIRKGMSIKILQPSK
jgi:uncharacterized membrane protein (UPF0127 family)